MQNLSKMQKGKLIPIEFNACRFGGMGVADLTYYATRHNPVLFYFQNQTISWETFWSHHFEDLFCWVLAYNAAEKDIRNYRPNHNVFKDMLPKKASMLNYIALDYKKMPAFAIVYLKIQNSEDLNQMLSLEFNDCFELMSDVKTWHLKIQIFRQFRGYIKSRIGGIIFEREALLF